MTRSKLDKKPAQSLGQYWLRDRPSLDLIVREAKLTDSDTVLEIGPGEGDLTKELIKYAGKVIAVEIDEVLLITLKRKLNADNLELVNSDIMTFDLTKLPKKYKVVANIPYYLTSKLLRLLSESANPPTHVVLLVQKEVAERVCAKPGKMSLLSVSTQYYFLTHLGDVVTANKFIPYPKVDSQVIVLRKRNKSLFPDVNEKDYFRIVKSGFSSRRKTLLNSLSAGLRLGRQETDELIKSAGLESNIRPQELSLDNWYKLYLTFYQ